MVVAAGVLLLVAAPFVARAWPVPDSDVSAVDLVERIRASTGVPHSGLVRSRGGVQLPTDESLESAARLLGRDGTVRVWWAGPRSWRLASLRTTGETDLLHRGDLNLRWVYESKNVTIYPETPVRLPNSSDVLPPVLAARVLDGVRPDEVERLPTVRVAGRIAAGLRLTPASPQSSVSRVDVWADTETGLPLRVELYGDSGPAALSTAFTDISFEQPDPDVLGFEPPEDASVRYADVVDAAAAADYYADRVTPPRLAGLPRRDDELGSVGLYGSGPTVLLALPLRHDDAHELRDELETRPGSVCLAEGESVATGPLRLLVTDPDDDPWLLAGTVTQEAAARAARQLGAADRSGPPSPLDPTVETPLPAPSAGCP